MSPADTPPRIDSLDPFREMIRNPAARVYLVVAGAGLLLTTLVVFLLVNSPLGAAVLFMLGLLALVLRWTAMPVFFVLALGYITLAPAVIVIDLSPNLSGSQYRMVDILLMFSVLTYLMAQYRLFSIIHAAMPFEAGSHYVKRKAKPTLRPATPISDGELGRLFLRVGLFTLLGQLLWTAMTLLEVDFRRVPPIVVVEDDSPVALSKQRPDVLLRLWVSRTLIALAFFVALGVVVRIVFWYWRSATLNRDQAKLLLTDMQWQEHRREIDRQEKWRAWMVDKMNGTPKRASGCGTAFMVIGLPVILLLLFWGLMSISGCVK